MQRGFQAFLVHLGEDSIEARKDRREQAGVVD